MAMFLSSWVFAAAAYVLFAGQFSADELVAAAACGLVAALWWASIRNAATLRFQFERAAFGACRRAITGLLPATAETAAALARAIMTPVGGRRSARPFIHGAAMASEDAGRRAATVLALSLAPNSFVLRTPEGRDEIDIHELAITPSREDARWPV